MRWRGIQEDVVARHPGRRGTEPPTRPGRTVRREKPNFYDAAERSALGALIAAAIVGVIVTMICGPFNVDYARFIGASSVQFGIGGGVTWAIARGSPRRWALWAYVLLPLVIAGLLALNTGPD
jgi:hypothetical protein